MLAVLFDTTEDCKINMGVPDGEEGGGGRGAGPPTSPPKIGGRPPRTFEGPKENIPKNSGVLACFYTKTLKNCYARNRENCVILRQTR